mmetsp:Transcript_85811/g.232554  ORF Transcript_85811/g.232554 Transcript_85811/m.232554 type:complete len:260 (-) Transcript_85811:428-1207(-)
MGHLPPGKAVPMRSLVCKVLSFAQTQPLAGSSLRCQWMQLQVFDSSRRKGPSSILSSSDTFTLSRSLLPSGASPLATPEGATRQTIPFGVEKKPRAWRMRRSRRRLSSSAWSSTAPKRSSPSLPRTISSTIERTRGSSISRSRRKSSASTSWTPMRSHRLTSRVGVTVCTSAPRRTSARPPSSSGPPPLPRAPPPSPEAAPAVGARGIQAPLPGSSSQPSGLPLPDRPRNTMPAGMVPTRSSSSSRACRYRWFPAGAAL